MDQFLDELHSRRFVDSWYQFASVWIYELFFTLATCHACQNLSNMFMAQVEGQRGTTIVPSWIGRGKRRVRVPHRYDPTGFLTACGHLVPLTVRSL